MHLHLAAAIMQHCQEQNALTRAFSQAQSEANWLTQSLANYVAEYCVVALRQPLASKEEKL